jgi:hypothetical protein
MEVASVDDQHRADDLEARIGDLERRMHAGSGSGGGSRREGIETAFWALMHDLFPQETRKHMKAAGREQLMAARSYLDHWIKKLDEEQAAQPVEREQIAVE